MKRRNIVLSSLAMGSILLMVACNSGEPTNTSSSVASPTTSLTTKPTTETTTTIAASKMDVTVTVVYPDGTPLVGKRVQWCTTDGTCDPNMVETNSDGVAVTTYDSSKSYIAHLLESDLPEGYSYNPNEVILTKDNTSGTIHLVELSNTSSGTGKSDDPYTISVGNYIAEYKRREGAIYYSFTATEAGEYTIESYSSLIGVTLSYYGSSFENEIVEVSTGGYGDNFKYKFNVSADETVYFSVAASGTNSFLFSISK